MDPVVSADWLHEHRNAVVIADCRWYLDGRSGRAAYESGHLPGSVFVELDTALAGPGDAAAGRHPLPPPESFAAAMSELGIGDEDTVVAYDDEGGVVAARLVWMLRSLGTEAAFLDGGIAAWPEPLDREPVRREPASFAPRPWPGHLLASADDLGGDAVIVDARNRDRYRGDFEPMEQVAGHVPGAINVPCRENLGADGRLLDRDELRRRFTAAGVAPGDDVVSYCGSGVTAAHNLLILELTGFGRGRLYPGSWSQYSRLARPVATGPD
ncbi:MAG: tst [Naasia sp.]|nr:tst [Naasia sp.]